MEETNLKDKIVTLFESGLSKTQIANNIAPDGASYIEIDILRKKVARILNQAGYMMAPLGETEEFKQASLRKKGDKNVYIITSQQNHTNINKRLWKNIQAFADEIDAEIHVTLGRYNSKKEIMAKWEPTAQKYWTASRIEITEDLILRADLNVSYTSKNPLGRVETLEKGASIIVTNPKFHSKESASLQGYNNTRCFTTGSISLPNYSSSVAGQYSTSKHKLGFLIVEVTSEGVLFRQVEADSRGDFEDIGHRLVNGKIKPTKNLKGIVFGDLHLRHVSPVAQTLITKVVEEYKPEYIVFHDALDAETMNFHLDRSATTKAILYNSVDPRVTVEINELKDYLSTFNCKVLIPQANHNERLDRALDRDWREDIVNNEFYMKYIPLKVAGKLPRGVLAYAIEEDTRLDHVRCFSHLDTQKIGGFEVSHHGHYGTNGARGSATSYINLNIPIILGHTHSTLRHNDCIYVGSCTKMLLGYNERGASSWSVGNVFITSNGNAILVFSINETVSNL